MRVARYVLPVAFLVAGTLALVATAARAEDKKAAKSLEGTFMLVSGEKDGKAIPEERIKGGMVRFTADKITGTDKDKKEFFAANYTLDTTKTPWAIAMKSTAPKSADAVGLVKKDGDTLTIVYALPGGEAPKEFKAGPNQHLFVLKAAKSEK
ncbi:TIGR03067 domain-containing protein [Gemmata sp.]|uniref:TIGR03067 domain-containing protein n=1 Tax=Gemmata sp. TaxID=1914242 RepID=UPI003F6E86EA